MVTNVNAANAVLDRPRMAADTNAFKSNSVGDGLNSFNVFSTLSGVAILAPL
jgi:hypothetical protein